MKVWTKITYHWDEGSQEFVVDEAASKWHEHDGPVDQCKKGGAPTPDPAIGQAAQDNIALGREWLNFSREQFAIGNERQKAIDELTGEVGKQQLSDSKLASERATQQWDRYQKLFQPIEDRFVSDAMGYDTPERQEAAAAAAKAGVISAANQQKQQGLREAAAMGINPASGRYAGIARTAETQTALGAADAENKARMQVEATGMALREGAANLGRGATSNSATQTALGLNAGNAAVGTAMGAEGNFRANQGVMQSGFQGGIGANTSGAGIYNQMYQNQLSAWDSKNQAQAAAIGGIAQAVGNGAGMYMAMV